MKNFGRILMAVMALIFWTAPSGFGNDLQGGTIMVAKRGSDDGYSGSSRGRGRHHGEVEFERHSGRRGDFEGEHRRRSSREMELERRERREGVEIEHRHRQGAEIEIEHRTRQGESKIMKGRSSNSTVEDRLRLRERQDR